MDVTKISTKKISEQVVEQIEQWVLSGSVGPGDKLPSVRELCEMFQVGRSAVRDALTTLKGRGIVDIRHGEGTFVCHVQPLRIFEDLLLLNKTDVQELYAVRKILEISTTELAALHRQESDLENMEKALEELKKQEQLDSWEADYKFHLALAEASQNKFIVQLMQTISTMMKKILKGLHQMISADPIINKTIYQQHVEIFKAIKHSDAETARDNMLIHLNYVEELLLKSLKAAYVS